MSGSQRERLVEERTRMSLDLAEAVRQYRDIPSDTVERAEWTLHMRKNELLRRISKVANGIRSIDAALQGPAMQEGMNG